MQQPELYEKTKQLALNDFQEAIPILIENMSPWKLKEIILDYGCGPGSTGNKYFLPIAESCHATIHGVDVSGKMIDHAKNEYPHSRVEYMVGNILNPNDIFPGGCKYDKIFGIHVLHFMKDSKGAIRGFSDALKPAGLIGLTTIVNSPYFGVLSALATHPVFKEYMTGIEDYIPEWCKEEESADFIKHLIETQSEELGLDVIHFQIHDQESWISLAALNQFYIALNPFALNIPCEKMEDFVKVLGEINAESLNVSLGLETVLFKYQMLSVVLRKKKE